MRKPEPELPWLTTTPRHSVKVRLFCFPHSGGGPSAYRSWSDRIPAWIDVIPIHLPGREQRSSEPPSTSLDELADALTGVVTQYTHRPFALFGHSLGALLAYEVARRLQRDGVAAPTALLVAGAAAPHRMVPAALHELPDDALLREIARLGGISPKLRDDENLLHAALPALRALGPVAVGALHDLTRSWTPVLMVLAALTVLQALAGIQAGRKRFVHYR